METSSASSTLFVSSGCKFWLEDIKFKVGVVNVHVPIISLKFKNRKIGLPVVKLAGSHVLEGFQRAKLYHTNCQANKINGSQRLLG